MHPPVHSCIDPIDACVEKASNNPFGLLDSDEEADTRTSIPTQEKANIKASNKANKSKPAATQRGGDSTSSARPEGRSRRDGDGGHGGGRGEGRGDRAGGGGGERYGLERESLYDRRRERG